MPKYAPKCGNVTDFGTGITFCPLMCWEMIRNPIKNHRTVALLDARSRDDVAELRLGV